MVSNENKCLKILLFTLLKIFSMNPRPGTVISYYQPIKQISSLPTVGNVEIYIIVRWQCRTLPSQLLVTDFSIVLLKSEFLQLVITWLKKKKHFFQLLLYPFTFVCIFVQNLFALRSKYSIKYSHTILNFLNEKEDWIHFKLTSVDILPTPAI